MRVLWASGSPLASLPWTLAPRARPKVGPTGQQQHGSRGTSPSFCKLLSTRGSSFGNPLTRAQWAGQLLVFIVEGKLGGPAEWEEMGEGDGLRSSIAKPQGQHLLAVQIQANKELPIPGFMGPLDFHVHTMFSVKILSPRESGNQSGGWGEGHVG